jgi:hypothetical protein
MNKNIWALFATAQNHTEYWKINYYWKTQFAPRIGKSLQNHLYKKDIIVVK